jgi:DNA-binding PadR family transcriptional regulator
MADGRTELLQGTLDMLVLKTLALEPMHGWGIAQRIQQMSNGVFLVTQGSLYPALVRMKRRGLVRTAGRAITS